MPLINPCATMKINCSCQKFRLVYLYCSICHSQEILLKKTIKKKTCDKLKVARNHFFIRIICEEHLELVKQIGKQDLKV